MNNLTTAIAAIRSRLEAATPGPWKWDSGNLEVETVKRRFNVCDINTKVTGDLNGRMPGIDWDFDGEFIAFAPQDIRILLDAVERLSAALKYYAEQDYYDGGMYTVDEERAKDTLSEVEQLFANGGPKA